MFKKPLAIDLFCGLYEAKFLSRANAAIEELVAGRAQNPDHVPLGIGDDAPSAVSLKFWLVGNLKYPRLATAFTCCWKVWIAPSEPTDHGVFEGPSRVVDFPEARLAPHEISPLPARRFARAVFRAISAVRAGRRNLEVLAALKAVSALLRHVALFQATATPGAGLARRRAVALVWPHRLELSPAGGAKQIVHCGAIP